MALDIALGSDLDLPLATRFIRGRDTVAQRVRIRLQQHLGDWVLDTSKGIPWATYLSTKPAPVAAIEASCRTEVEATPGVLAVQSVSSTLSGRDLSITITYTDSEGDVAVALSANPGDRNFAVAAHAVTGGPIAR